MKYKYSEGFCFTVAFFIVVIPCVILAAILFVTFTLIKVTPKETDTNVNIESVTKTRDSIKLVINNLDSIKNAKIIEVKALDNDSTVKLFYELIRE